LNTTTSPAVGLVTKAAAPPGATATSSGPWTPDQVALTWPVVTSITDTLLSPWLATNTRLPSGATATSWGVWPTRIVPRTVLPARSTTDTSLELRLTT
jgi:hypothetical protein